MWTPNSTTQFWGGDNCVPRLKWRIKQWELERFDLSILESSIFFWTNISLSHSVSFLSFTQPYLHESRHLHALRRARGCGGRFANTKKPHGQPGNSSREEGNGIDGSPDSEYAPPVCDGVVERGNEFQRVPVQESNGVGFFQSFLSRWCAFGWQFIVRHGSDDNTCLYHGRWNVYVCTL